MKKIFIVHGWTYSTEAWTQCMTFLRGQGYEPVTLTVPGLTEASDRVWTLEEYVAWLREQLKNEQDVILVGHSNGGRIGIAYAAQNPAQLKALILEDAAGIVHNELPLRIKRAVFGTIAKIGKPLAKSRLIRKVFYRLIGAKDYERAPVNMRETMKNLITQDLTPVLHSISAKTLILWGKKDTATPLSDAYIMNTAIPGAQLHIIEDAGHSPHASHPEQVATKIGAWLKTCGF